MSTNPVTLATLLLALPGLAFADSLLYANTGPTTMSIVPSQNFEQRFDADDAAMADDFKVPAATAWQLTEVDVKGYYFDFPHAGPAQSWHVTLYDDDGGKPGVVVADYNHLQGVEDAVEPADGVDPDVRGPFWVHVGIPQTTLQTGHYWVSVVANLHFQCCKGDHGQWGWATFAEARKDPAQWQNPGGGFDVGCPAWTKVRACWPVNSGPSAYFRLMGSVAGAV